MAIKDNESLLKDLWNTINENDIDTKVAEDVLEQWKSYRGKIETGSLALEDYTSLITADTPEYLTNFLERTSSKVFGTSKGGNANQYMLKRNAPKDKKKNSEDIEDKETYYFKTKDKKIETEASKDKAKKHFEDYILPILKDVVSGDDTKLSELENNKYEGFEATQILRKMVILNDLADHKEDGNFQYIQIFQDNTINKLYKDLVDNEKDDIEKIDFYTKNKKIAEAIYTIIDPNASIPHNIPYMIKLTSLLWKFENMSFNDFPTEECPNVIFYGAPGTGKTHAVKEFLKYKNIDDNHYVWVQFHPSYTYEDFIDGIKPTGIEGNQVKLELCNGMFKDLCIKAKESLEDKKNKEKDKKFYFIADEINRANLSNVFGETLSLLEADYRDDLKNPRNLIQLQNSKIAEHIDYKNSYETNHLFGIPKNVYFIGMMNDVDKSIDSFDLALRRRFKWIRKDCDYEVIEREVSKEGIEDYIENCKALNAYISGVTEDDKPVTKDSLGLGKAYEFGHSFFLKINNIAKNKINEIYKKELFESYLRPTLKEYLRSFSTELEIEKKLKEAQDIFCKNN